MPQKKDSDIITFPIIKSILITQPKPIGDKSPYFDLAKKYNLNIEFSPFIEVKGIDAKEFKKQKININEYTGVIFTSRNAIDHFFRICEELKSDIPQSTKYFCITEAVALYLQKFILYRKRKVFYGADGVNKSLFEVIAKHKDNEKFLYPCSENFDSEITNWLKINNCEFTTPIIYQTVSCDVKEILKNKFDIICFFTPSGVKSLFENCPKFNKKNTSIAGFGDKTIKAITDAGLKITIKTPLPNAPSMVSGLDKYLSALKNATI